MHVHTVAVNYLYTVPYCTMAELFVGVRSVTCSAREFLYKQDSLSFAPRGGVELLLLVFGVAGIGPMISSAPRRARGATCHVALFVTFADPSHDVHNNNR